VNDPIRLEVDDLLPEADAIPDPDAAGLIPTDQVDENPGDLLERVLRSILVP